MSDTTIDRKSSVTKHLNKLLFLAVLLGIILLTQFPNFLIRNVYIKNYKSTDDWMVFVVLPATSLVLMVGSVVVFIGLTPKLAAFEYTWFRWSRREFVAFLLLPLGIVTSFFIVRFLAYRFGLPLTGAAVRFETGSYMCYYTPLWVWLIIRVNLLSPVVEEVFWRGYVQSAFRRVCPPALAVLGQAILFGLAHFRPVLGFLQVFLFGLIFGIWCYRRKTLLPVIIMHIAFNSYITTIALCDQHETRQVKITHNYIAEFIRLSKPTNYDPNDDARQDYAKAIKLVNKFPKTLQEVRKRYPTEWRREERVQVEVWVTSNEEALNHVKTGVQKPYYWAEYERQNERMPLLTKGLDKARDLAFALSLHAMLRTAEGQFDEGIGDIETCYRFGRHLAENKEIICRLVGYSVRATALQTARIILAHEKIDGLLLHDLQKRFEEFAEDDTVGFDFTAERILAKDAIQCIFTDDGHGSGHVARCAFKTFMFSDGKINSTISRLPVGTESDFRRWRKLERRKTTEQLDQYYDFCEKICSREPWQYRGISVMRMSLEALQMRNPLIEALSPGIEQLVNIGGRARIDRDATIAILAILRYKEDTGQLPDTLAGLVSAGYLKAVPSDSFQIGTITYRQNGDDFLFYSFGADFDDDGGTPSKWGEGEKGGDQVFWPVQKSKNYSDP